MKYFKFMENIQISNEGNQQNIGSKNQILTFHIHILFGGRQMKFHLWFKN